MAYPLNFRQNVFTTKETFGLTFQETGEGFDTPISLLCRWQNNMEPCLTRKKSTAKPDMEPLTSDVMELPQ